MNHSNRWLRQYNPLPPKFTKELPDEEAKKSQPSALSAASTIEDADNFAVPAPTAQRSFALRCRFRLQELLSLLPPWVLSLSSNVRRGCVRLILLRLIVGAFSVDVLFKSRAMWIDICFYEFTHVGIGCQVGSCSCSTGLYFYIYCTNWWLYLVSWSFQSASLPMSWLWSWPFQVQQPHVGGWFVYIEGD